MSRAVRMVPPNWQHPMEWREQYDRGRVEMRLVPKPLYGRSYAEQVAYFEREPEDLDHRRPDPGDYMPDFPEGTATHYAMYEEASEGTPISPAFATVEELAQWLAATGASAFGDTGATYEQWLATCRRGWAPTAVVCGDGLGVVSGVEGLGGA